MHSGFFLVCVLPCCSTAEVPRQRCTDMDQPSAVVPRKRRTEQNPVDSLSSKNAVPQKLCTENVMVPRKLSTSGKRSRSRAGELLNYLIMHSTKPGSEPNNLLRRLQRTNIGWELFRQLRHQYAAGALVQQYTLLQSIVHPQPRWTETSQQQQFQK